MRVLGYEVVLAQDSENGGYVVTCPRLPGCYSQGQTQDEALANIREAILLCLDDQRADQQPAPSDIWLL